MKAEHPDHYVIDRRSVLKWSGAAGMLAVAGGLGACAPPIPPGTGGSDENGLILAPGFTSRIIARGGEKVPGTGFDYRVFPDGAATFADGAVGGGWYHVVNHEIPVGGGGVTATRFAPDGTITDSYSVLSGTNLNCAGGKTPWGTWLSGEELEDGYVWECDPTVPNSGVRRSAMGRFQHEAAAVAADGRIYLTEDRSDGCLYRFTPAVAGDLSSGLLEVATGGSAPGPVVWLAVPDPLAGTTRTRHQVASALPFDGGEGIDTIGNKVWFTTKGDNRVWEYDTSTQAVSIRVQAGGSTILDGVDNLLADASSGVLLVAEDGGDMQLVAVRADNSMDAIVQVAGHEGSEITGPAFSPDGQRLYFSSQRGPVGPLGVIAGITYEVTGPFDALLGR